MTNGTTAERQTQTVNLIRQFYAFILNAVSDVVFLFLSNFGCCGFHACGIIRVMAKDAATWPRATGLHQSSIMRHQRCVDPAIATSLQPTPTPAGSGQQPRPLTALITVCADRLFQMNVRYESVTGRGYTITCLFAGIYIADVSSSSAY